MNILKGKMSIDRLLVETDTPTPFLIVDENGSPVFMRELSLLVERIEKSAEEIKKALDK